MSDTLPERSNVNHLESLDAIAVDLQRLRSATGLSYGEIAARIAQRREAKGASAAAAQIARSSVYDAFRTGRARVNPDLVAEIVVALGGDESEATDWRARCLRARAERLPSTTRARAESPLPWPRPRAMGAAFVTLLTIACLGLNLAGPGWSAMLGLPLYLDMIGTAIAAIALGPWYGAAVGVATNGLAVINVQDPPGLWFALVNVAGALLWGYGVRTWRLGRGPLRFLALNAIVAIGCSIVAIPIVVLVFGGITGRPSDMLTAAFGQIDAEIWASVTSSNLVTSLADKLLAGYIGLGVTLLLTRSGLVHSVGLSTPPLPYPAPRGSRPTA